MCGNAMQARESLKAKARERANTSKKARRYVFFFLKNKCNR